MSASQAMVARLRDSGWHFTLAATALIAIVVGSRSSFGLFLSPINTTTGLGLGTIGFAAALGQLGQGVAQPLIGALSDRHGASRVIAAGAVGFAIATALLAMAADAAGMALLIVLAGVAGTAMGSIAMLLGEVSRRVPAERQGIAAGNVGAGGSAGQLVFGPMTQATIESAGWMAALWLTASIALLALPLSLVFRRRAAIATPGGPAGTAPATSPPAPAARTPRRPIAAAAGPADGAADDVARALRRPAFWLIGGSFAVCGFHMSFLTMHMPGFIEHCGLPAGLAGAWLAVLGITNVCGSVAVGMLLKRTPPATLLLVLHLLRAVFIAGVLALPATAPVLLVFAIAMGATYMAVLPPSTMLVTQTFGARRLATLFGLLMLLHQIGSFAGSWLGGLAAGSLAGYHAAWLVDVALALLAAALHLPFRQPRMPLAAVPAVAAPAA